MYFNYSHLLGEKWRRPNRFSLDSKVKFTLTKTKSFDQMVIFHYIFIFIKKYRIYFTFLTLLTRIFLSRALLGSAWILFHEYVFVSEEAQFQPTSTYPGVAYFMQNLCIFASSVIYKFGRTEDLWGY